MLTFLIVARLAKSAPQDVLAYLDDFTGALTPILSIQVCVCVCVRACVCMHVCVCVKVMDILPPTGICLVSSTKLNNAFHPSDVVGFFFFSPNPMQ